jgi:hypothetical protein
MSKKRYYEIESHFRKFIEDSILLDHLLQGIRDILNFDPSQNTYTPELGQKIKQHRHKLREEKGISTYISSGRKNNYERNVLKEIVTNGPQQHSAIQC